jgi:cytochrome c-type biogenesis protein CcsB
VVRWWIAQYFPLTSFYESLLFFSWVIVGTYLWVDFRSRLKHLGSFALPIVLIVSVVAVFQKSQIEPLHPSLQSIWLILHTSVAFVGYGAFTLVFCLSIMYLLQDHQLKAKHLGKFYYRLPSLTTIDYISYKCLSIGFPFFTLGIVLGSIWASYAWGAYWQWDPKETWSLITWFMYAVLLHSRLLTGWRGRKAAYISIVGFIFVLFTFVGVNLLPFGLHTYTR